MNILGFNINLYQNCVNQVERYWLALFDSSNSRPYVAWSQSGWLLYTVKSYFKTNLQGSSGGAMSKVVFLLGGLWNWRWVLGPVNDKEPSLGIGMCIPLLSFLPSVVLVDRDDLVVVASKSNLFENSSINTKFASSLRFFSRAFSFNELYSMLFIINMSWDFLSGDHWCLFCFFKYKLVKDIINYGLC